MSNQILHRKIVDNANLFNQFQEIPDYIQYNFSRSLRNYQIAALQHFMFIEKSNLLANHLLFHMATGSGKTLIMSSIMLFLFKEKNYSNFWFVAPTTAIVNKTRDNLSNQYSSKYLFRDYGIVIESERIIIKIVDKFPVNPNKNTIYLKMTTIHNFHQNINQEIENSSTLNYFSNNKVAILADEAHHYFSETKNDIKSLSRTEAEIRSWERSINKILVINQENKVIGFSATFNLNNEFLFHKIKSSIVYQYDLKEFMNEGYSKNVTLIRANESDEVKMLNAILLSQYKKYIAKDNDIFLKPVVFFKANRIKDSKEAHIKFRHIIDSLNERMLGKHIADNQQVFSGTMGVFEKMFNYYSNFNITSLLLDLKFDFSELNIIDANDAEFLTDSNIDKLNNLEDLNNPFRVVFAVAKLNEGWDVLNLFDIVRISEGSVSTTKETDSEAQLIGRGARYYPFKIDGKGEFKRRFDFSSSDLGVIETLHYHTINENTYINKLSNSLASANIQVHDDKFEIYPARLKKSFRSSKLYKEGKVYINKVVETKPSEYDSLIKYGATSTFEYDLTMDFVEQRYGLSETVDTRNYESSEIVWIVEKKYTNKALQKNSFYNFDNLVKFVPTIKSKKEFVTSINFLEGLKVFLKVPVGTKIGDVSPKDKLYVVERFLSNLEIKIKNNYRKFKGTPIFEGVYFSKVFDDYFLQVNKINKRISKIEEKILNINMKNKDWFVYDVALVNQLENSLIDFIASYMDKLKDKYKEVYLIRNEKRLKIVEIDGFKGFMPDFLLYLRNEGITYQVFLEPKGDHLREEDKWKEEFLMSLSNRDDIEVLAENDDVKLLGIKFYSDTPNLKNEFRIDFSEKLL